MEGNADENSGEKRVYVKAFEWPE